MDKRCKRKRNRDKRHPWRTERGPPRIGTAALSSSQFAVHALAGDLPAWCARRALEFGS